MTLMKSLLLGSAAALVTVAAAQAADLPTKKGAPAAEYVKVCKINGNAGFIIPGTDECLKISGIATGQVEMGNLKQAWNLDSGGGLHAVATHTRSDFGMTSRGEVEMDFTSNTAYGPLLGVVDWRVDAGEGFKAMPAKTANAFNNDGYPNQAYVQWAGVTAGVHDSFYDFIAGGETWENILSPEHSDTGIDLLAYTATFGGGFSATISLEDREAAAYAYADTSVVAANSTLLGDRAPDIVESLDLTQAWGGAHLAFVEHNVYQNGTPSGTDVNTWGWGGIAGLTINLPSLGAGDVIKLQGSYSHAAIEYSGLAGGPGWGANGNMNGNGVAYVMSDAFDTGAGWAFPTTWGGAAEATFQLTPQFSISPEISYVDLTWSKAIAEGNMYAWFGGAVFDWSPVKNLDFALDLVYMSSHFDVGLAAPASTADGFDGRLRVTRTF